MPSDRPALPPTCIDPHLRRHPQQITREMREARNGQRRPQVGFSSLSRSGRPALTRRLEERLFTACHGAYVLDGNCVRHGLSRNLGFAEQDRAENTLRIGCLANPSPDAGSITLACIASPCAADRCKVRELVGVGRFIEVCCRCPTNACESRDVKGIYARAGVIARFTGVSTLCEESIAEVLSLMHQRDIIPGGKGGHVV